MRIRTSENYFHDYGCALGDCDRHYCDEHRLLWRDCETAVKGLEGDRDAGGTRVIYENGDCPECEAVERKKKHYRGMKEQYPKEAICPVCFQMDRKADTIAIHLMDAHRWDLAKSTLWLRDEVERMGDL